MMTGGSNTIKIITMTITVEPIAIEKFTSGRNNCRVLALFFIIDSLDNADIREITGMTAVRVSEALAASKLMSLVTKKEIKGKRFAKNDTTFFSLSKNNIEFAKSLVATTMLQEEHQSDKAKIELLLKNDEIRSVFK